MSEKKPEADARAKTEGKAEAKADAKPEAKAGAKPEVKPDAKPSDARPSAPIDKAAAETAPMAAKPAAEAAKSAAEAAKPAAEAAKPAAETAKAAAAKAESKDLPEIEPPGPKAEPWPDATPVPMKPVEPGEAVRQARTQTVTIPVEADVGRPPDMPKSSAPPPLALGAVEDPTHLPGPKDIPSGNPGDPAPPPGRVPPGDSRSLRRAHDFALVYRVGTCVVTRTGTVGTRGQWRVVEYPTAAFASSSYAKECSRFVSEGFSDYRD